MELFEQRRASGRPAGERLRWRLSAADRARISSTEETTSRRTSSSEKEAEHQVRPTGKDSPA
jgi:hypothetical protein